MVMFIFKIIYNIILFVLYRLIWKNIIKRIIRMLTGTHEIQRVLRKNNYEALSKYY